MRFLSSQYLYINIFSSSRNIFIKIIKGFKSNISSPEHTQTEMNYLPIRMSFEKHECSCCSHSNNEESKHLAPPPFTLLNTECMPQLTKKAINLLAQFHTARCLFAETCYSPDEN